MKTAELSGTFTMPADTPAPPRQPQVDKMTLKKTGGHDVPPGTNAATPGAQPPKNPQAKAPMRPHVDVSGFEPPKVIQKKEAQVTALRGRYPLDSYEQVKTADAYLCEWGDHFSPADRHEYAVNTLKRALELGIAPSACLQKHGSTTYAPLSEIKVALDARKNVVLDDVHKEVLDKMASLPATMTPDSFAALLSEFDKTAGINHLYDEAIDDPYYSTFGFQKKAEFSETIGNMTVSEMDLEYLATKRLSLVKNVFTEGFAEEFRKNPVDLYKSLPVEQRKVLGNMAREQRSGAPGSG